MHLFARAAFVAALVTSLGSAALAAPETPFSFRTASGNLPKNVRPVAYTVAVTPDPQRLTLRGSETVTLDVFAPTRTLVFNAMNMRYDRATVDGVPAASVVPNDRVERTTLTLRAPLKPGRHTLALAFRGRMETTGQGLFVQPYVTPNGGKGTMISTQFESTDARRMFPCWDEPAFKATFQLSVTVPASWSAVNNMPVAHRAVHGDTQTIAFARTPVMSSYLVELTAGDLAHVDAVDAAGIKHEVWAVRGQEDQGRYALANSQQILASYNDYFGVRFPLPRLASIAIPGGFGGAMENWGAITYNDQILLMPPGATIAQQQHVYAVQAHEMAHQWFGDLVTMGWWDDIWLNESFASWMAARQTALANPSWLWWQQQDASKENAMAADAHPTSHPIFEHVTNELEADFSFDSAITYDKGQALLRMTESYLGNDAFRSGIRAYMHAHKYSNTTSTDLWNALGNASGKDVAGYAASWIYQPGFPVVSVTATCDAKGARTIALAQSRFLLEGSDPHAQTWQIPVGIAAGTNATPSYTLLTAAKQSGIAAGRCNEPLVANAGNRGLYRVKYDDATFAVNRAHFASLSDDDKIAMLDDQWALAQAGQADLGQFLALVDAMGRDRDARAWTVIANAFATIERDERGTPGHDAFAAYARKTFAPLYASLGSEARVGENPPEIQLRQLVREDLGAWGDAAVIGDARARFVAFLANPSSLPANQQATVFRIVAENADQATFDNLHVIARHAGNTGAFYRDYGALGAVRDPALAQQVLAIVASSEIPPQANRLRMQLVREIAVRHPKLAYAFFQNHVDTIYSTLTLQDRVFVARDIPRLFRQAASLDAVAAVDKKISPPGSDPYIAVGVALARFDDAVQARLDAQADKALAHAS